MPNCGRSTSGHTENQDNTWNPLTGENPPPHLLTTIPNWEFAQDEEDTDGQDETTTRPEGQQSRISANTAYTAGVIYFANKSEMPAFIAIIGGRPESFWVYDEAGAWCLSRNPKSGIWEPFVESWLPIDERCRSVQGGPPNSAIRDCLLSVPHVESVRCR
jgi:hypothetical protein